MARREHAPIQLKPTQLQGIPQTALSVMHSGSPQRSWACDPDIPLTLLDDSIAGRQAKSRASAYLLGGEERLEDPFLHLL